MVNPTPAHLRPCSKCGRGPDPEPAAASVALRVTDTVDLAEQRSAPSKRWRAVCRLPESPRAANATLVTRAEEAGCRARFVDYGPVELGPYRDTAEAAVTALVASLGGELLTLSADPHS